MKEPEANDEFYFETRRSIMRTRELSKAVALLTASLIWAYQTMAYVHSLVG